VEGLQVGETTVSVEIRQGPGGVTADFRSDGPPVDLTYVQALPPGSEETGSSVGSGGGTVGLVRGASGDKLMTTFTLDGRQSVQWRWSGGLRVEPPHIELVPGQRSRGYRVVDFHGDGEGWLLTLEGEGGRSYRVDVYGEAVTARGAEVEDFDEERGRTSIHVRFPSGADRTLHTVRFRPAG
jgi:hypothetical protein